MLNGIVKQSKFLLFITVLYLKDFRHAPSNPIFDVDLDLISDLVSLTEDWVNLQKRYDNSYAKANCYLPQNKWVLCHEDSHNYTQLIEKYRILEETDNEENEEKCTIYIDTSHSVTVNSIINYWIIPALKVAVAYLFVSKGHEIWIDNQGIKRISRDEHLSPSNSVTWNFGWDDFGGLNFPVLIGFIVNLSEQEDNSYTNHGHKRIPALKFCSESADYVDKVTLTVVISAVILVLRLFRVLYRLVFLFNEFIYFLFTIYIDAFYKSNIGSTFFMYLIRTIGIDAALCRKCFYLMLEINSSPILHSRSIGYTSSNLLHNSTPENSLVLFVPKKSSNLWKAIDLLILYSYHISLICMSKLNKYSKQLFRTIVYYYVAGLREIYFVYSSRNKDIKSIVLSKVAGLFQSCIQ